MSIFEYDQEEHMRTIANEGKEEGMKSERLEGIRIFILDNLEKKISKERIIQKLQKRYEISEREAFDFVMHYSK